MKAVIATAGYSTRFLPVCKSVPKSMLPMQEVPIIHEIVKECIDAGITDVILVTSFGNYPVEDYFDNRPDLETFLKDTGKEERYERFNEVFGKVNITVVRQNKSLPYGNGSPVLAAKPWLKEGEPFVFIFSDDLVLSEVSAVKQLVDEYYGLLAMTKVITFSSRLSKLFFSESNIHAKVIPNLFSINEIVANNASHRYISLINHHPIKGREIFNAIAI
ncbi:MAG: glucose-1-phosphate uridylyltransferase [candidate division WS6 bacterium GW2011_GWC2_36_7]|uniref:UTP--glucose-1-phosphate uridylyltransferase n=1 Tax=candidate division WS6 bacterium GW2011_GWC2_36_7 TaxID=1619091 RepID=A0A0G0HGZ5_9BACT|nr:MAG: glucose-1-phosphate uridylyltransferase [candidate division WS6 bacterium GW2011_GWC2_36_7]